MISPLTISPPLATLNPFHGQGRWNRYKPRWEWLLSSSHSHAHPLHHHHLPPSTKVTDWHCIRLDPTAAGFRQLRDQNRSVWISQDIYRLYAFIFQRPLGAKVVPFPNENTSGNIPVKSLWVFLNLALFFTVKALFQQLFFISIFFFLLCSWIADNGIFSSPHYHCWPGNACPNHFKSAVSFAVLYLQPKYINIYIKIQAYVWVMSSLYVLCF